MDCYLALRLIFSQLESILYFFFLFYEYIYIYIYRSQWWNLSQEIGYWTHVLLLEGRPFSWHIAWNAKVFLHRLTVLIFICFENDLCSIDWFHSHPQTGNLTLIICMIYAMQADAMDVNEGRLRILGETAKSHQVAGLYHSHSFRSTCLRCELILFE